MPAPVEVPQIQPPTKAELHAQKRRDRLALNQLKILIQRPMDQIRQKYKKFRHGIIDERQFQYLFDEADPSIVTSDLPQDEQRLGQFRPYEKAKDERGEDGLIEVATGKFYYNLEIITIERRLANGYYMRPRDFTADIAKLTKDAKTFGDEDRFLKAKELQTNVQVDMDTIETTEPYLVSQLNDIWEREQQSKRKREEEAKKDAAEKERHRRLTPANAPSGDQEIDGDTSTNGPLLLENPATHHPQETQTSPSDPSQRSSLTNGISGGLSDLSNLAGHQNSNGTSVPSRETGQQVSTSPENQQLESGDQHSSFGQSAQTRPQSQFTGPPQSLEARKAHSGWTGSLSQRDAITPMAPDSTPQDYQNYASTTSSEKKNTGSSGPFTQNTNTQSSEGRGEGPDLSMIPEGASGNSQLPNTQSKPSSTQQSLDDLMEPILDSQASSNKTSRPSSQTLQNGSTTTGAQRPTNINAILNTEEPSSSQQQVSRLLVDKHATEDFVRETTERTSGCSVEQLEQIYSAIMDKIWKTKGEWNRRKVVETCRTVVDDCLADMRECQSFLAGSMDSDHY